MSGIYEEKQHNVGELIYIKKEQNLKSLNL